MLVGVARIARSHDAELDHTSGRGVATAGVGAPGWMPLPVITEGAPPSRPAVAVLVSPALARTAQASAAPARATLMAGGLR